MERRFGEQIEWIRLPSRSGFVGRFTDLLYRLGGFVLFVGGLAFTGVFSVFLYTHPPVSERRTPPIEATHQLSLLLLLGGVFLLGTGIHAIARPEGFIRTWLKFSGLPRQPRVEVLPAWTRIVRLVGYGFLLGAMQAIWTALLR